MAAMTGPRILMEGVVNDEEPGEGARVWLQLSEEHGDVHVHGWRASSGPPSAGEVSEAALFGRVIDDDALFSFAAESAACAQPPAALQTEATKATLSMAAKLPPVRRYRFELQLAEGQNLKMRANSAHELGMWADAFELGSRLSSGWVQPAPRSLELVLSNNAGCAALRDFLAEGLRSETLEFWLAVESLRKLNETLDPSRHVVTDLLAETFVCDGARKQINISGALRIETLAKLHDLRSSLDAAPFAKVCFHTLLGVYCPKMLRRKSHKVELLLAGEKKQRTLKKSSSLNKILTGLGITTKGKAPVTPTVFDDCQEKALEMLQVEELAQFLESRKGTAALAMLEKKWVKRGCLKRVGLPGKSAADDRFASLSVRSMLRSASFAKDAEPIHELLLARVLKVSVSEDNELGISVVYGVAPDSGGDDNKKKGFLDRVRKTDLLPTENLWTTETYLFSCESKKDRDDWFDAIVVCASVARTLAAHDAKQGSVESPITS